MFKKKNTEYPLREKSNRSKFIYRSQLSFIIATILLILSIGGYVSGIGMYRGKVRNSSSPIGSNLVFQRSNASMHIKNIFTTKSRNVLVVRFGADISSQGALPYKGEDYSIFLRNEVLSRKYPNKYMKLLFGKLASDGDFFLVIPNPEPSGVYDIMIMNKRYLPTNITFDGRTENNTNVDFANNLTQILSNQTYKLHDGSSNIPVIPTDDYDVGAFRLALNPSLDSPQYQPIELDAELLDEEGNFDFELFFDKIFKENSIIGYEKEYEDISQGIKILEDSLRQVNERLIDNPRDTGALQKKTEISRNLNQLNSQKDNIIKSLSLYESIKYNPNEHFNDLLDYGFVLPY